MRFSLGAFVLKYLCIHISTLGSNGMVTHQQRQPVSETYSQITESPFVTFITSSKGRDSLHLTVSSILAQHDTTWLAIIVFNTNDTNAGFRPAIDCPAFARDPRFLCAEFVSSLRSNCAGTVRNYGISLAKTSWIAFVDDDDTVAPQYVTRLRHHVSSSTLGLVSFRMYDFRLPYEVKVIPRVEDITALRNYIGISFAFKQTSSDADYFIDGTTEDYDFIHKYCTRAAHRLCLLSSDVVYFVKGVKPAVELLHAGKSSFFKTYEDRQIAVQSHITRGKCLEARR